MLNTTQKVYYTGESVIGGKTMERYNAQIDFSNPENLSFSRLIADQDGYRDNRTECQKDEAAFEDIIYSAQAEMIEQKSKEGETAQ